MALTKAFIPKGVLRPLFTFFSLHLLRFLFKVVLRFGYKRNEKKNASQRNVECEMFYGDDFRCALRTIEIEIHDLHRMRHEVEKPCERKNQMFYELVSGVFYCTTSSLLILVLFTTRIIKREISFLHLNWFLMYNQAVGWLTKGFRNGMRDAFFVDFSEDSGCFACDLTVQRCKQCGCITLMHRGCVELGRFTCLL